MDTKDKPDERVEGEVEEEKDQIREHKINIDIVAFGKFKESDQMPLETALRTRIYNAAKFDGKFEVTDIDFGLHKIKEVKKTCACDDDEEFEED